MAHSVLGGHRVVAMQPVTGSIALILGPMFSGKTSELLKRVRRHVARKERCLVLKYRKDTRYSLDDVVSTHDRSELAAMPVDLCQEADNLVWNFEVVAIDEGQFMPDIAKYAEKWANQGIVVIIAALDGTFQRQPFPSVLALIALAETVEKLHAVCGGCGADAGFTQRLGCESAVEVVGGKDKYRAVCRGCYNQAIDKKGTLRRRQSTGVVSRDRDLADLMVPDTCHGELPAMRLMRQMSLDSQSQSNPANPGRIPFDDLQPGLQRNTSRSATSPPHIPGGHMRRSSLSATTLR